ncbi:hypothetical protein, partial [Bacilliculturomica massiliensis]|uniref:hypothetical protein n=1 Tax=Bacilliculturomica massiliensis TaxID=1917867 RepID=UPI0013EEF771
SSLIYTMNGGVLENCVSNATVNDTIGSSRKAAGLVLTLDGDGIIRDCSVKSDITVNSGWASRAGGIVYTLASGTIERCSMLAGMGRELLAGGGIAYEQSAGTLIKDCYSTISVYCPSGGYGGIAYTGNGTIENCYHGGGRVKNSGIVKNGTPTLINCYYKSGNDGGYGSNADVEGQYEARTEAELKSWETVAVLNGTRTGTERVWTLADLNSYPSLDTNQPEKDELQGTVTVSGDYKVGSTLTSDVSGVLPAAATYTYQWQESADNKIWSNIQGAQSESFEITISQAGKYVRLQLVGAGTFEGSLASATTVTVANGSQTAPEKATVKSKSDTTILVNITSGVEYAIGSDNTTEPTDGYKTDGIFTGLTRNTTYYVWARTAAKPGYEASAAVASEAITTNKTDLAGVTIGGTAKVDQTLTATVEPSGATATYQWYRGTTAISGATDSTYKLTTADAGQKIKVTATGSGDFQGSVTSSETAAVESNIQNPPAKPTMKSKSDTTITMNTESGVEYAIGSDNTTAPTDGYKADGTFTGLTRNTTYYVWARTAAKPGYDASAAVASEAITTEKTAVGGTVTIDGDTAVGQTLTANVSKVTPSGATLSYAWKRGTEAIQNAASATYQTTAADAGKKITVTVTGTRDFTGELSSEAVEIGKKTQDAPAGLTAQSPTTAGASDGKITGLDAGKRYEYKLNTAEIYTAAAAGSTEITGLTAGVYYVRFAETETMNPSEPMTVTVNDGRTVLAGTVAIDGTAKYGETLTANVSGITTPDAAYDIKWYRQGTEEAVGTTETYTLGAEDIDKVITLKIIGKDAFTGELSAATEAVGKAAGPTQAPAKPQLAADGVTDTTVTLLTVEGQEYRQGETGEWQTSGLFENLTTGTRYEFYTRVAATQTQEAGAVSEALAVTTLGYGITLDNEGEVIMTPAAEGYINAASTTVTVTNTGTGTVTGLKVELSGEGAANFTVSSIDPTSIAVSGTAIFTVTPKTGLTVGTYSANVIVSGDKGVSGSFRVSFTVTEKPAGVSVSGTMSFGAGKVAQIDALTAAEGLTINAAADGTTVGDYTLSVTEGTDAKNNQNYATFAVTKTGESKAAASVTIYDTSAEQNADLSSISLNLKAASLNAQAYEFTLNTVSAGTYKVVTYKKNHTTATMNGVIVAEAEVALGQNMVMLAGDLDGDNLIKLSDYSKLTSAFGNADPDSDLDDNNFVMLSDYSVLTSQFDKTANIYSY